MSQNLNSTEDYKALPIIVGAESETGHREENQDHMTGFTSRYGAVYVVADGMGGHRGGAEASRMVTEGVRTHLLEAPLDLPLTEAVRQAAQLTNQDLFHKSATGDPNYAGMGSTLTLVVIGQGSSGVECVTAHVGDSRVYLERGGRLSVLTKDHTYVQKLLDSKILDEEAARTHPDASILTRAMGQNPEVVVDIGETITLEDGDGILLCSDGLSGYVPQQAIEDVVRSHPAPSECAKALIELALANGSDDNVTVQFVRYGKPPAPPASAPRRNRKTVPESEALTFVDPAKPSVVKRSGARWLFPIVPAILLLLVGGLFAFRHSLFPESPGFAGPYANELKRANDLNGSVIELDNFIAKDLEKVSRDVSRGANDARFPEFSKLQTLFKNLNDLMNSLEQQTKDLPLKLGPAAAKSERRDAAKVAKFDSGYNSVFETLGKKQDAYNHAHASLHDLESRPAVARTQAPPPPKRKKKKVAHGADEDGR